MTTLTLEGRITALEEEVRQLRRQQARDRGSISGRTAPDFLERFRGIHAGSSMFDDVVEYIEEKRRQEHTQTERESES